MNQSLIAVGIGGVLLGGVGGFLVGGGSSGGKEGSERELSETKTNRSKVVVVGAERREVAGGLSEIYVEGSQTERVQRLLDYYANLGPGMFEEEAGKLEELPFSERILASYLLFSQWAEVDPISALSFTENMGRAGFLARPTILQGWASTDPAAAAEFLKENPRDFRMMGGRRGDGAAGTIATEWARQDPQAALEWSQSLTGAEGSRAVSNVIREVAGNDPQAALALAQGLDDEAKESAFASIAREWAKDDWGAMEAWANSLPSDQRDAALARGVRSLAQDDPELAGAKLLTISDQEVQDGAFEGVIENWAKDDPAAAMDFLITNGSEAAQSGDAMREAMQPLARTDSAAALEVIGSLDDSPARDRAVSTFVFTARDGDLAETVQLAATIGDDETRERAVSLTARRWIAEDQEAATNFFESSDLIAPETLERIQSGGGNRPRFNGRGFGR